MSLFNSKFPLYKYRLTIERVTMETWRGVKVPFTLYVRLHYPTGSRIWFYLWGSSVFEWCKKIHLNQMQR